MFLLAHAFVRALRAPPIAPSALSDFRAVGRGGASRRLRRGFGVALSRRFFDALFFHVAAGLQISLSIPLLINSNHIFHCGQKLSGPMESWRSLFEMRTNSASTIDFLESIPVRPRESRQSMINVISVI